MYLNVLNYMLMTFNDINFNYLLKHHDDILTTLVWHLIGIIHLHVPSLFSSKLDQSPPKALRNNV